MGQKNNITLTELEVFTDAVLGQIKHWSCWESLEGRELCGVGTENTGCISSPVTSLNFCVASQKAVTRPVLKAVSNLELIMPRTIPPWVIASAVVAALDSYKNNMETFIAWLGFASLCTCSKFIRSVRRLWQLPGIWVPSSACLFLYTWRYNLLSSVWSGVFLRKKTVWFPELMYFDMGERWHCIKLLVKCVNAKVNRVVVLNQCCPQNSWCGFSYSLWALQWSGRLLSAFFLGC